MCAQELLERRVQFSRLYDLYGPLLTEKQRRIYEMHELDDLSLSEISEELSISRQGVSDQLTRVRARLEELEGLLGFAVVLERIAGDAEAILDGNAAAERAGHILDICTRQESGRTMDHV